MAGRVPFRGGPAGLGEHRSEDDDIARSHVLADRAVVTAMFDDPLHGAVDLVAYRQGFRGCDRRPAMQRQHEFVPLGDRGLDETPQRVAGGRAGETINVPANAPHAFTNAADTPSRLLCLCAPAGQEEFFTLVGQPVATRTQAPPPIDADAQAAFITKSQALAPEYKTELLPPPGAE